MPLKILLLSHRFYPDIGGIETVTEFLAQSFLSAGHKVHVLTWSTDQTLKAFPFKVVRKPNLLELLYEHAWADIVFENNPCLRLAWPNLIYNRASIVSLHTWISRADGKVAWQDSLKLKWLKKAKKVIACSNAISDRCWPEALVICNPYQENVFKKVPDVPRSDDFVFVGRLVSDKGADIAIQATHQFNNILHNSGNSASKVSLTVIGDGPEREKLECIVNDLGLKDSVFFTGSLRGKDLANCLNRHRFILVPSVWEEPFGIVALEGMACGCLPIVSDGGGLPDAVGDAGLIFKRGDIDALVACMQQIFNNPELEQQLRESAERHLEAHHSAVVTKKYLQVLESALIH